MTQFDNIYRHTRKRLIAASFAVSLLLDFMPLPLPFAYWLPEFTALMLIFWLLHRPQNIGISMAFVIGLLLDIGSGAPLGLLLSRLFIPQGGVSALYFLRNYAVLLVVCCVCSTQLPGRFWQCCKGKAPLRAALCGVCFVLCTAYVVAATGSTALYANF